jgi:hypothetical protein
MGPIASPETSVLIYLTQRNDSKDGRIQNYQFTAFLNNTPWRRQVLYKSVVIHNKIKTFRLRKNAKISLPLEHLPGVLAPSIRDLFGVKRPASKADHSLPPNTEVTNVWMYPSTPRIPTWTDIAPVARYLFS